MNFESFTPEDAHRGVLNELRFVVEGKLNVNIFGATGAHKDVVFVRVSQYGEGVPISAQRTEHYEKMAKSVNGFGGTLADMIRSCRFEVEATRKKCDAQMEFPFPKGAT